MLSHVINITFSVSTFFRIRSAWVLENIIDTMKNVIDIENFIDTTKKCHWSCIPMLIPLYINTHPWLTNYAHAFHQQGSFCLLCQSILISLQHWNRCPRLILGLWVFYCPPRYVWCNWTKFFLSLWFPLQPFWGIKHI